MRRLQSLRVGLPFTRRDFDGQIGRRKPSAIVARIFQSSGGDNSGRLKLSSISIWIAVDLFRVLSLSVYCKKKVKYLSNAFQSGIYPYNENQFPNLCSGSYTKLRK